MISRYTPWVSEKALLGTSVNRGNEVASHTTSVSASACTWFVSPAGLPGAQAGPPGGHRASVGLVVRPEPAGEGGFLVPADECCGDQPEGCSVHQQTELAQEQPLTDDGRQYGHIHGVADIAIQPADDQALRRGDRRWCPEAFYDETYERLNQHDQSCDEQYHPEHPH